MKIAYIATLFLFLLATAYAVDFNLFATKSQCEFNSGYWCERCSNNEGNTFGADKCVATSGDCLYGPSMICGSACAINNDCKLNLTDDSCMFNGLCSAGTCNYVSQQCPRNGTIVGNTCHYGRRECSTSGCSVSKCALSPNQVCDPTDGCVSCGKDDCGTNGDYLQNRECRGDDVFAERVTYSCNATACLFSKTDARVQECSEGCDDGECNELKCNFKGIIRDCNVYDGFFEQNFCLGKDVYRIYRDYHCGVDNCEFDTTNRLIQECSIACSEGKCTTTQTTVTPTTTSPVNVEVTDEPRGQVARSYTQNVYNGWLFGRSDLEIETMSGRSGVVKFKISEANKVANLKISTNGINIFYDKPQSNEYSINFENSGNKIVFSADSSGLFFFMPNSYYILKAYVTYDQ